MYVLLVLQGLATPVFNVKRGLQRVSQEIKHAHYVHKAASAMQVT